MKQRTVRVTIRPTVFPYLALLLLTVPFRWSIGIILAGLIHEVGHLIALKLFRVPIHRLRIGFTGAEIETGFMTLGQELVCAVAGPAAGGAIILFADRFPTMALCALLQTLYNMIPIYPSDGARALACILRLICAPPIVAWICTGISYMCLGGIGMFLVYTMRYENLGLLPVAGMVLLLIKGWKLKNSLQSVCEQCTIVPL